MSTGITANTPRPKPTRGQGPSCGTWIFLIVILLGPGRGILMALLGPRANDPRTLIVIGGVVVLAAMLVLAGRAASGRSSGPQLPTGPSTPMSMPRLPTPAAPMSPTVPGSRAGYPLGPPQFEPIITGKVVLAGVLLLLVFAGIFFLLWIGQLA